METTEVRKQSRGAAPLIYVAYLAGAALLGIFFLKPKLLDAESRRAKANQEAAAQLESAHKAASSAAAGSVAAIGAVNAQAPASPQKNAIAREVPVALSLMEAPDPQKQIEALTRMNAVMEGRLAKADELYQTAADENSQLRADLSKAKDEAQQAQNAITEAAAANLAKERLLMAAGAIIVLLGALWGYTKVFGISRGTIGTIIADIRSGTAPTQAFDTHLAPWHHKAVQKAARIATPSE